MNRFHKTVLQGELLFREGEPGDCAYVIDEGCIAVVREHEGTTTQLAELGPGACIGEMALISHQPRMATAIARTDTQLTVITPQHLEERLQQSDPFVRHLLQLTLTRYLQSLPHYDTGPSNALLAHLRGSDDEHQALTRMRTEQALAAGLERREFVLYFQPIVRLKDRVTTGFEALLRWNKPGAGLVAPDLFIPVAEESHIIEDIGRWIIGEACRNRKLLQTQWQGSLAPNFSVSVNLAARQFPDPELVPCIDAALRAHQMAPAHLRMEVTESQILENWTQVLSVLQSIKALGCKIAIDDFGTGHSSLAYLNRLPVDTLKIDKAFLQDLFSDTSSRKIIAGVAAMAQALELSFIAEGAETLEQVELLETLGVEYVQGYYFGRPFAVKETLP